MPRSPGLSPQRPVLRLRGRNGEAGYILIGVLILVALFFIALAVAAPIVAKDIERDKEVEAVQRGKQYTRAIKLYYKRYGSYPTTIKALENTNNIRYLRKRYTDPITGKDDWRLIHVGEAKVPVMGFFGKPLAGAATGSATTGLAGNGTGGIASAGNASAFGGSTGSSTGFGTPIGSSGSTDGSNSTGPGDNNGVTAGGAGGTLPGMSGGGQSGVGTTGTATTGTSTGTTGFNGSTTTGSGGSGFDGGGPIVGVGIPMAKKSLVVYHKQDAFNKWEFTYDPIQDQVMISNSGSVAGATPIGSGGAVSNGGLSGNTGGTNNGTPFGSSTGAPADGSAGSAGSTPTGSTPPATPTEPQN